ncbi:natural cytotoxicity triggering receptor 2-like [Vulpes vulpes]|uniref:Natural cytotoxicity triggering receptor 2-like n=1 Tax=Vulpes vulpes TaxID=9627 RepID=A0A3Q7RNZ7_VULVU
MRQAGLLPPHPDSRLSLEVPAFLCPWPALPKSPTPQAVLGLSHFVHLRRLEELSRVRPAPGSLSPVSPMFPAASTQGKDWMVWRAWLLPLLLLPLLIPGSWALPEAQHLHRVAGQTLSVTCRYPPKGWPYQRKGWCKEVSPSKCTRLVSSSSPHKLVQASRFSIWDNPSTGLFIVTMIGLKEEDSGYYWCRIYRASSNAVSKSVRFYLAVSPAPTSMQVTEASSELVSSQTQSSFPTTASSATITPSQPQNSTLHSAAPSALVPMLCAFLVAKSLVLSALLVWWDMQWKTLMELRSPDAPKATCHFQ